MDRGEVGVGARACRPEAPHVHPAQGVIASMGRKAVDAALVDRQKLPGDGMIGGRHCRQEQHRQEQTSQERTSQERTAKSDSPSAVRGETVEASASPAPWLDNPASFYRLLANLPFPLLAQPDGPVDRAQTRERPVSADVAQADRSFTATTRKERAPADGRAREAASRLLHLVVGTVVVGHPGGRVAVVLEPGRRLQAVLGRVHDQVHLPVLHGRLHRIERDEHVLFARAEEAADADDQRVDLAGLVDQHVLDLSDLVVVRIIDVLLVPVGDGHRIRRYRSFHFRGWRHGVLGGVGWDGQQSDRRSRDDVFEHQFLLWKIVPFWEPGSAPAPVFWKTKSTCFRSIQKQNEDRGLLRATAACCN